MECPKCHYEPRERLLHIPCPNCNYIWVDTERYVRILADPIEKIDTVLDIGCGLKGVIAQHYWEKDRAIQHGYACDRHVVKILPPLWRPLVEDAEELPKIIGERSIDFITHCGLLEHVEYEKALRVLRSIELVSRGRVFSTCSAVCREVDYKVKRDGNPFHYYRSFWNPEVFEALGYTVDRRRMLLRHTFTVEVPYWFDSSMLGPWAVRAQRAIDEICKRRCHEDGCDGEPIGWSPFIGTDENTDVVNMTDEELKSIGGCFCFNHIYTENREESVAVFHRWMEDPIKLKEFPIPPWRTERLSLPTPKEAQK